MITYIHIRRILLLIMGLFLFAASASFAAKKPEVIKYNAQYLDRAISINVQWQSASPVIFVRIFAGNEQKEVKVDEYDNKRNPYGYTGEVTVVVNVEPAFFQESVGYTIQLEDDVRQKSELITGKVEITPSVAREREDDSFGRERTGVLPSGQRDTKGGDIVDKLIGVMERHDAAPYLDKIKVNILSAENVNFTTKATDDKGLRDITFRILDGAGNIAGEEVLSNLGKVWQGTTKTFTLKQGDYKVVAQAIDTAGNTSKEQTESLKITGVMPLHGSLTVNIMPEAAVKAGAQWRLAGGEWQNSGAAVSGLLAGAHNIDFKDVAGFIKPSIKSISIQAGQTTAETASYDIEDSKTGSLNVIITPQEVSALGAKWSIDGTNWHEAGKKIDIAIGTYTVRFSEVKGWGTPASQTVEIKAKGITPAQGNYKKEQGSLTVTIIPQAVIEQGAQWRLAGGAWQGSGATVSGLPAGAHNIDFKDVAGFIKPSIKSISIQAGLTTTETASYSATSTVSSWSPNTGVCLIRDNYTSVPIATAADIGKGYAKLNKPNINTIEGLRSTCTQTDYANLLASYCATNSNSVQQQVMTFDQNGNFLSVGCGAFGCNSVSCSTTSTKTGSLNVTITPQEAVKAGAQWRVAGGAWQGSGATVSGLSAGQHTIEFKEVTGWGRPANQVVTVQIGQTTTVTGNYIPPKTGGVTIYTSPSSFNSATASLGTATVVNFESATACTGNTIQGGTGGTALTGCGLQIDGGMGCTGSTIQWCTAFNGSFYSSNGITFSTPNGYPLYIAPAGLFWNSSKSLSIGRFPYDPLYPKAPEYEDDSLVMTFSTPVRAVGFVVIDSTKPSIEFKDSNGNIIAKTGLSSQYTSYRTFIGIVSTNSAIKEVNIIDKGNDGDDVNYDDVTFYP